MTYAEAIAVLRRYNIEAVGNTLHIKGKDFESGIPNVAGHADYNGAWLSWSGEGDLPRAIAMVIAAEIKRDDALNALEARIKEEE